MIFVSGIHGVGKSFFCKKLKHKTGIKYFSASELITLKRKKDFSGNKLVPDIEDNQPRLLEALEDLKKSENEFVLDGHFCLLNEVGEITRISSDTFSSLKPDLIVLLTDKPEVIAKRRWDRDKIQEDLVLIESFQKEEKIYATEISKSLGIPLIVSNGASDIDRVIGLLKEKEGV